MVGRQERRAAMRAQRPKRLNLRRAFGSDVRVTFHVVTQEELEELRRLQLSDSAARRIPRLDR